MQNGIYRYEGKVPADKNYPPELPTENTIHVSILALDRLDWNTSSNKPGYGMLIVCDNLTRVMWHNYKSYGLWRGWLPIAMAAPPQKFELPLAEGWTKYQQPYYQRNAFGEVTIWGSVKKDSAIAQGDVIATIPAGFRIPVSTELPAIKLLEGAPAAAAVFVRSYGDITAATTSTGSAVLSFVITYAGQ